MWHDNETDRDFLNFTGVAEAVAAIILQSQGKPVSIGVSGGWGTGKSSMIQLIRKAIVKDRPKEDPEYVFVVFNAWLYQGFDDARAALIDVVASKLATEAKQRKKGIEKVGDLLKRLDWFRTVKLTAGTGIALATGLAPVGLLAEAFSLAKQVATGKGDEKTAGSIDSAVTKLADEAHGLLKAKADTSPPKEIHATRDLFEESLAEMNVRLVVLIDDLDRCLPETTIATLEAVRLLLFLKNTAFVIAADDQMIKNAVKKHFDGVDDELTTSYFDKLIQVPIGVPPLGIQEVKAYLMMLYIDNSTLVEADQEKLRELLGKQLRTSWQGSQVTRTFVEGLGVKLPPPLVAQLDTAERLAPLMTTATNIAGNPRLIKRFLNTLDIRLTVARSHGVTVDEPVLAKLLLFERCGEKAAYNMFTRAIIEEDGKPKLLAEYEVHIRNGDETKLVAPWNSDFLREWLSLPPQLADKDLRGALYVSKTHAPILVVGDKLSSEAMEILTALRDNPDTALTLKSRLEALQRFELAAIMAHLLDRARSIQDWGVPPILEACLVVLTADPSSAGLLVAFLAERPAAQIKPAIIPRIKDYPWAGEVFAVWMKLDVSAPVKKAIKGV